jgi:paraquat-inducible protein A
MALAAAVTAAELWVLMNVCPLVRLSIEGISRETTLAGAAMSFFVQGMPALSALVVLTAIAAPGLEIGLALYVLGRLETLRSCGHLGAALRWLRLARRWSMVDVFLLGCMVAIVKLAHFAQLVTGPALWASAALIPLLLLLNLYLDPRRLASALHA